MTDKEKLIQIRNLIDEHLSGEESYFRNFQAEIVSKNRVNVTWESNMQGLFDIEYYRPDQDREWQHSVAKYREPIPIQDLQTSIGFNSDVVEVRLRAVKDGEVIEEFEAKKNEEKPEPIYFGYWDAHAAPDNQPANIHKLPWNDLDRFHGSKVIPMIGGFRHDDTEADIRKRLSDRKNHIDSASDVEWVMLMDEPFYKNFTPEKQELLIQCAKEEMGDYKYGFAYARGALVDQPNADRRIPSNLDVAMVNYYPFYDRDYIEHHEWWHMWITTEAEFQNDLENVLDKLKDVPEVYLTGQGHKSDGSREMKYRQPPIESVQWYVNACYEYGLKGVLWWLWASRSRSIGMGEMPELYEEHKRVFETITDNPNSQ